MGIRVTSVNGRDEIAFHCEICGSRIKAGEGLHCFYRGGEEYKILEGHEVHPDLTGNNLWLVHKDFASKGWNCCSTFEEQYNAKGRHFCFHNILRVPIYLANNMELTDSDVEEIIDFIKPKYEIDAEEANA